jgi:biopolymer transport protein ExbB
MEEEITPEAIAVPPSLLEPLLEILDMGGPVVAALGVISVITLAVVFYKLWQFSAARVGRHKTIKAALTAWDQGHRADAGRSLNGSRSYLIPIIAHAFASSPSPDLRARLEAEAEIAFAKLERGFRLLESVAQLAPLLGLFGTVLGMIEAFQALQNAGAAVDPALLAGGIWVALLTTAVGLGVAMPTSLVLAWFDGKMAAERAFADQAFSTILAPQTPHAAK